ncbi:MAG: hypothetical protein Q8N14_04190 [Candidatus Omnitrophota bacterium]|nr:hypothetical protein [Candidatus Omnitrophota bacterium]
MKIKPNKKVKIRRFWTINPKTRVKKNAKVYACSQAEKESKKLIEELLNGKTKIRNT